MGAIRRAKDKKSEKKPRGEQVLLGVKYSGERTLIKMVSTNIKEAVLSTFASAIGDPGLKICFEFCRIACSPDSTRPEMIIIPGVTCIKRAKRGERSSSLILVVLPALGEYLL